METTRAKTHTYTDEPSGRVFTFTRPGFDGLQRLYEDLATAGRFPLGGGGAEGALRRSFGAGNRWACLLDAYLTKCEGTGAWQRKAPSPGSERPGSWDLDRDAEEVARVGKAVEDFHGTFRDVDKLFGIPDGQDGP